MKGRRPGICDERGIATSLVEATLVVAISAILASVALMSASDQAESARMSNAQAEVRLIGVSILSFIQDNGFPPTFQSGQARGSDDATFLVLESAGADPDDMTEQWELGLHDELTNHLVHNAPGEGIAEVTQPYPRVGFLTDSAGERVSRTRGWNGPYMSRIPRADPWGDKYLTNVGFLAPGGRRLASEFFGWPQDVRLAVFVLSAGPNQTVETEAAQAADAFVAGGDDIVFRIQ